MREQLGFDWTRRERSANRTDDALQEIDVPCFERALIWILLMHPEADCLDRLRKLVSLSTSYAAAGKWLKSVPSPFGGLTLRSSNQFGKSNLRKAASEWGGRGVLMARGSRCTTFVADFEHLRGWSQNQSELQQRELEQWTIVSHRVPSCPIVSPSDGERERIKKNLSITQADTAGHDQANEPTTTTAPELTPAAAGSPSDLPALPDCVYQQLTGRELYEQLRAWWQTNGLTDRGFAPDEVMGAILAGFHAGAGDPQKYVEHCLRSGVNENWRRKAAAFRRKHSAALVTRDEYGILQQKGYAPSGVAR